MDILSGSLRKRQTTFSFPSHDSSYLNLKDINLIFLEKGVESSLNHFYWSV